MRLKKIQVLGLFGVFKHEVDLKDNGITIIIGENGLGKTIFLEMIEAFFQSKYYYFSKVNFHKLAFTFFDDVVWEFIKVVKDNNSFILELIQKEKNGKANSLVLLEHYEQDIKKATYNIARRFPHLRRVADDRWEDRRTSEVYSPEDILQKYSQFIPNDIENDIDSEEKPAWFLERHTSLDVNLIETQRLINIDYSARNIRIQERTVEKYSNELSEKIKYFLSESTELSSSLDRTYPNRLIEKIQKSDDISDDDLYKGLEELESKRKLLDAVGLIEIGQDSSLLKVESQEKLVKEVLMLYVEDSMKKIEIFDGISNKIKIFLDVINKRFKHKKLKINKDKGFLFVSTLIKGVDGDYQEVPVNSLSSGEQNELVLFYLLLFKTEEGSLVLIDEPEVSLHISWQNSFIKDLSEIVELNNLEVIIATHSPDIISDNWHLKVELKGLE